MTPTTEQRLEHGWAKCDDAQESGDLTEWDRLVSFWCGLLIVYENDMRPGLWELPAQHEHMAHSSHSIYENVSARTGQPRASQRQLEIAE